MWKAERTHLQQGIVLPHLLRKEEGEEKPLGNKTLGQRNIRNKINEEKLSAAVRMKYAFRTNCGGLVKFYA